MNLSSDMQSWLKVQGINHPWNMVGYHGIAEKFGLSETCGIYQTQTPAQSRTNFKVDQFAQDFRSVLKISRSLSG